jgi:hypothetical protein
VHHKQGRQPSDLIAHLVWITAIEHDERTDSRIGGGGADCKKTPFENRSSPIRPELVFCVSVKSAMALTVLAQDRNRVL